MPTQYRTESDIVRRLTELKGPAFQAYRERWNQVNAFELETDFPMFLHIEPNYHCNFECPMCVQGIPELKQKFGYDERLKTEDIRRILEEGAKHGCQSVSFQGDNEPLLIKEIPEWFAMARDLGYLDIMVNSNGSAMTPRLAERILKSGLTRIRFSIDSVDPEIYAQIRIGGVLEKTLANIDMFLAKRAELGLELPMVGVNAVKMNLNAPGIDAFIDHFKDKVDFIVVQDFMTPDTEGAYEHMDVPDRVADDDFRCNQPWQRLYIRGNGEVTPCCAMFSSYLKLGNIRERSLHDLWNDPMARDLRKLHKDGRYRENDVCLKCSKAGGG